MTRVTRMIGSCVLLALLSGSSSAAPGAAGAGAPPASVTERFRQHGVAEPVAKSPGMLRLAAYNVHELYDEADDPALSGRSDDLERVMPESRRAAIGDVLRRIDADVLALQEVESLQALEWFRDGQLSEMGYTHAASVDVGHSIGLEQSVLSRVPIVDTRVWIDRVIGVHPPLYRGRPNRYAGEPLHFRRSPLMVELDVSVGRDYEEDTGGTPVPRDAEGTTGGTPVPRGDEGWAEVDRLTLLVVHMKTGQGSVEWRRAEAEALVGIVAELRADRPGRRIVLLGDFVGEPGEEGHVDMLLEAGFVDIFAELATSGSGDEIATDISGRRECLVLAGPNSLSSFTGPRFVVGTVAPPSQLRREMAYRMPGFASDHYPVVADVSLSIEGPIAGEASGVDAAEGD